MMPTYVPPLPSAEPSTGKGEAGGNRANRWSALPQIPTEIPSGIADPPLNQEWFEPGVAGTPGESPARSGASGGGGDDSATRDGFAIVKTLPRLLNSEEVTRALVRNYPAFLRDAGVGGDVLIWLLIDENGRVIDTDVRESSGHAALDKAAMEVGEVMRFSPASNRDQRVKVWVSVPVKFRTR